MDYLETFISERNLSDRSYKQYKVCLLNYCSLFFEDLKELKDQLNKNINNKYDKELQNETNIKLNEYLTILLNEADQEEEQRVRDKNKKLKQRLLIYRNYLINEFDSINTQNSYLTKVKTFYKHFEISIPYLPPVQQKSKYFETYKDIPTKKDIKMVIDGTNTLKHKAILLFMVTSGTAIQETVNLTIYDFFKSTQEYHKIENITNETSNLILNILNKTKEPIIPVFYIIRQKTNYPYYTCCSYEATKSILDYLSVEYKDKVINVNDSLFNMKKDSLLICFNRWNKKYRFGNLNNGRSFFHSHNLRKFHASMIDDENIIHYLQGRKPNRKETEIYLKKNPQRIKNEYLKHMDKLTFNETKVFKVESEEYKELKKENEQLKEQYVKLYNYVEDLKKSFAKFNWDKIE